MRRLNLDQLQSFLAVAETGSFSATGRRVNLTQSDFSLQIEELAALLDDTHPRPTRLESASRR